MHLSKNVFDVPKFDEQSGRQIAGALRFSTPSILAEPQRR
jgi:hypothetical protein